MITDVLEDDASTGITTVPVDIEAIRVLTETKHNIIYDNVQHIYMSKESCTLNMKNLPDKEADEVYALIGGYGSNYINCYGWQNDPNMNPLIFDKQFLIDLFKKLSVCRNERQRSLYRPTDVQSTTSTTAHNNSKSKVSGLGQHSPEY
jgi:hypothetical protein